MWNWAKLKEIRSLEEIRKGREDILADGPKESSEEHTSELQSQSNLVCRLLLEKKKKGNVNITPAHCCHDHLNDSTSPMISTCTLDVPVVRPLLPSLYEV